MPPVIKFEVDLESSFISDILERSITDLESFLSADGVKLLSNTSKAASVSNASLSTWGQIYFDVTPLKNFFNIKSWLPSAHKTILMTKLLLKSERIKVYLPQSWRLRKRNILSTSPWILLRHPRYHLRQQPPDLDNGFSLSSQYYFGCLKILRLLGCWCRLCQTRHSHEAQRRCPVSARHPRWMIVDFRDFHYISYFECKHLPRG